MKSLYNWITSPEVKEGFIDWAKFALLYAVFGFLGLLSILSVGAIFGGSVSLSFACVFTGAGLYYTFTH